MFFKSNYYSQNELIEFYYEIQFGPYLKNIEKVYLSEPFYLNIKKLLKKYLNSDSTVLDLGCGLGRVLFDSASFDIRRGMGVDQGKNCIAECKKIRENKSEFLKYDYKKGSFLDFRVADASKLPFSSSEFNRIISLNLLDRSSNPQKIVDEIFRVLEKNGILIICCPYDWQPSFTPVKRWIKDIKDVFPKEKWEILFEDKKFPFEIYSNPNKYIHYDNHLLVLKKK